MPTRSHGESRPGIRPALLAALAVAGFVVPLWLGARASLPPPVYFLHDQQHYRAMADPRTEPAPEPRTPPFAWRVLPPALVRASGLPTDAGFHALTLVTLALIPPAVAIMLSAAGASAATALALGAVTAVAPAVAGYLSWDFIRPDGPSLLLIVLSAWAAIRGRPLAFVSALAALSLTKETWLVSAAFALGWSAASRPSFLKWAVAGSIVALGIAASLRVAIPASQPYSFLSLAEELYRPLDATTIARRLLLATAGTWNVLTPLIAFSLAGRYRDPRAWAVGLALLVATGQILVAIDTQRLVAAAYPFALLACAWEMDRLPPRRRVAAAVLIAGAQIPWLLTYARVWPLPLRGVEMALAAAAVAAVGFGIRAAPRSAGGSL